MLCGKVWKTATRYRIGVVTVAWLIANVQHITSAGSKHVQHHREALLNAWAFHCKSQAYTPCQGAAKSRRHFLDSCRDKQFESVFTSPNFLDHTFSCLYVWPALELLSAGGQRFHHCSWQIHGVRSKISLNAIQRTFSAGWWKEKRPPSTAAIAVGLFRDNFFKLEPEQTKRSLSKSDDKSTSTEEVEANRSRCCYLCCTCTY